MGCPRSLPGNGVLPDLLDEKMVGGRICRLVHNKVYNTVYTSGRRESHMVKDVVKELGYLALGTRLKRLGERFQAQTQVLLEQAGLDVPASHFPLLGALDRLGALSVRELTEALGVSQPGVTRMLDGLETEGWVQSIQSEDDRRLRTVELSKAGRQIVTRAKRTAWPVVEAAVADACTGAAQSVLGVLAGLETSLAAAPLSARAERLRSREASHESA